ncbi:hypothetical protein AaE_012893 [Aphanomyces astaci]|uniref:HAUS augmin-like complex subunit 3 N-terminal domain-containing protein n=1 Tax=Aphanomyces astaci TaxID=112090 RepID=A0A6A4ZP84_APHAT|nr:hypothetical protein AaE_012893 [Aphanomyces astaci]
MPHMFHELYQSPSVRLHAFLHWFLDVVSPDQSTAKQFTAAEQAVLASLHLESGDELQAKESMQQVDDDESRLLADIARLERQHSKESRKADTLHRYIAATEGQAVRMGPRQVHTYPLETSSGMEALDHILDHLAEGSNALELAVLSPTSCISLSVQEDKMLDHIQAHVMPYFQNSSPPRQLSVIAESPMQSHTVTWMLEALAAHDEILAGGSFDYNQSWSQAIEQWRAEFVAVEMAWLQANLTLRDDQVASPSQSHLDEGEIAQWMEHTVPALLDAVADARVSSLVVGDYPNKYLRQERHLEHLDHVLDELERQTARLQLMALVLAHEKNLITAFQSSMDAMLRDMQRQLLVVVDRMGAPLARGPPSPPEQRRPADTNVQVSQVQSMQRQVRHDWVVLGHAQERLVDQLREILTSAPTLTEPLHQVCRLKDLVETDLAHAIERIHTTSSSSPRP